MKLEHMKQNKARSIEGWGGVGGESGRISYIES